MHIKWQKELKWSDEQLEDMRYAGYAYLRQGKYQIALTFFEALTVLAPENPYDLETTGALYLQLNQPKKALEYFDKALKLESEHSPTLMNVSKALFMLGRRDEGLKVAKILSRDANPSISNTAKALILAYGIRK